MIAIDDEIRDKELQYSLSSCKIDKYEYLTGEEILPYDQSRMIEQIKFTSSLLFHIMCLKQI